MIKRKIIHIDQEKCNGCGQCIPNCAEGALEIVDDKARLVKDSYCDGLGACLGHCPMDAIKIIEREADAFDQEAVDRFLADKAKSEEEKHSCKGHNHGGCPGSRVIHSEPCGKNTAVACIQEEPDVSVKPQLRQWPVQLGLVPVEAPFFKDARLLVTADCVPFAYADYHLDLLKGRAVVVGCPKLDDIQHYIQKLTGIVKHNDIRDITVAYMEVPCCSGLVRAVKKAVENTGKAVPVRAVKITTDGRKYSVEQP